MTQDSKDIPKALAKFVAEPEEFSAGDKKNPLTWFRRIDRIRRSLGWKDETAILVAASHLRGRAELWWDSVEHRVTDWKKFDFEFKKQFCAEMEDVWWGEIQTKQQEKGESVDDVALTLRDLFKLVEIKDEKIMVRYLIQALRADIAVEVERRGLPKTWEETVSQARKVEQINRKYQAPTLAPTGNRIGGIAAASNYSSASSSASSSNKEDETSSIGSTLTELVKEMQALKINLVDRKEKPRRPAGPIKCFVCDEEGHKSFQCPKKQEGKDQGRQ